MFLLHFINNPKFLFQYPGGKEGFAAFIYLFIYLYGFPVVLSGITYKRLE